MKQTIICTVCPNGCEVQADYTCPEDISLSGYGCGRGKTYAYHECFDPRRTFTSSVRISGAGRRMLPVRSSAPVPKVSLMDCAAQAHAITVETPIRREQILAENFCGTGADLVAAMTLEREA